MKTIIMCILLFWLLPAWAVCGEHQECWPCYDCLADCERGDGAKCCREAKKECCRDCRFTSRHYQMCLDHVDSEESYMENRIRGKINGMKQRFMEEMDGMLDEP